MLANGSVRKSHDATPPPTAASMLNSLSVLNVKPFGLFHLARKITLPFLTLFFVGTLSMKARQFASVFRGKAGAYFFGVTKQKLER